MSPSAAKTKTAKTKTVNADTANTKVAKTKTAKTNSTIKEIIAAKKKAEDEIHQMALVLQVRREDIRTLARGRAFSDDELSELSHIKSAMLSLGDAAAELGRVTVVALEQSPEVKNLAGRVESLNSDLKSKMNDVEQVAKRIEKLGDLFKAVGSVVSGLTKLAALVA